MYRCIGRKNKLLLSLLSETIRPNPTRPDPTLSSREVVQWMHKIQHWYPKFFTLIHLLVKYHLFVSKFLKIVLIIARMAESPKLASAHHRKLREAYETKEKM